MLENIIAALKKDSNKSKKTQASFCARYELNPQDLAIKVTGFGKLKFPLNKTKLQELLAYATLAKFGKGTETILDTKVRNTNEIAADKLKITYQQDNFNKMLNMLNTLNTNLGLQWAAAAMTVVSIASVITIKPTIINLMSCSKKRPSCRIG